MADQPLYQSIMGKPLRFSPPAGLSFTPLAGVPASLTLHDAGSLPTPMDVTALLVADEAGHGPAETDNRELIARLRAVAKRV